MKKTDVIIGAAIIVFMLGIAILIARPNASGAKKQNFKPGGTLVSSESMFDFGSISMAAGSVSHVFKIKNSGQQPMVVAKIFTSCMCTVATLITSNNERSGPFGMPGHGFIPKINKTLQPGEEASVEIVFDPAAHGPAGIGRVQREVFIEEESGPQLQLTFSTFVTP